MRYKGGEIMTRYYKQIEDGFLTAIGTGPGGEEIAKEEYDEIMAVIRSCPAAEPGTMYRLRPDLTWEQVEVPVIPEEEQEISDEQALDIILGGGVA